MLSDLDPAAEAEQEELSRLTLIVGELELDVGLPSNVAISAFIADVVDIANEQLAIRNPSQDLEFDDTPGRWTLARFGGDSIDPHRSLNDAGIFDGEMLMIREAARPLSPILFDDVEPTENTGPRREAVRWLTKNAGLIGCFVVTLAATLTLAMALPSWSATVWVPAAALGLGIVGVVAACLAARRPRRALRSAWVAAAVLPLLFAGAMYVVPGGYGVTSVPMACALTALAAVLILLSSGQGRALFTAVVVCCALAGVAATVLVLAHQPLRNVGAVLATAAVIVVYLAPRATILLSKLPIPRVPSAGEPLDDIETQGGTTVEGVNAIGKQVIPTEEGMITRVRRANGYLTGILVAAALAAVVGSYLAVDVSYGFFWQGTAFGLVIATVLCLRGRSHHDLVQSAALIGAGLLTALAVIVKTALFLDGVQFLAAIALIVLTTLLIACGLAAPKMEFSPVMRRVVEIVEYITIALVFPLCFWIIRLYAFFRELRI